MVLSRVTSDDIDLYGDTPPIYQLKLGPVPEIEFRRIEAGTTEETENKSISNLVHRKPLNVEFCAASSDQPFLRTSRMANVESTADGTSPSVKNGRNGAVVDSGDTLSNVKPGLSIDLGEKPIVPIVMLDNSDSDSDIICDVAGPSRSNRENKRRRHHNDSSDGIICDGNFRSTGERKQKRRKKKRYVETDSSSSSDEEDVNFPFAIGRNPVDVDDPIVIVSGLVNKLRQMKDELSTWAIPVFRSLGKMVSPNHKHLHCFYCNKGRSRRDDIIAHYTSKKHLQNVVDRAKVFSMQEDVEQLDSLFRDAKEEQCSKEVRRDVDPESMLPFMYGEELREAERHQRNDPMFWRILSFENLFNKFREMDALKLLSSGFFEFLRSKFRVPERGRCNYCKVDYDSTKHFLGPDHIARVMSKKQVFTASCWNRLKHALQRQQRALGHKPKDTRVILWEIEKASKKSKYSKDSKQFKDLKELIDSTQPSMSKYLCTTTNDILNV